MKKNTLVLFRTVLGLSFALVVGWLGFGSPSIASAASPQIHEAAALDAADTAAYRWEAAARYFASHQTWPISDLTTLNAADISAYRWEAMARFYVSRQASMDSLQGAGDTNFRLFMIEPGFWAWQADLSK